MKKNVKLIFACLCLVLMQFMLTSAEAEESNKKFGIKPDSEIQKWISGLAELESQEQLRKEVSIIQQKHAVEQIIQQIVYFQTHGKQLCEEEKLARDEFEKMAMVAHGTIAFLLEWESDKRNITFPSAQTLVNAVVPYLNTSDIDLRKKLYSVLMWVDQVKGSKKDYSFYESYIKPRKESPPQPLVKYMYKKAPDAALSSMAAVYLDKDEAKALIDQVKGEDDAQAVDRLSKRPEWWAKLYVAEKMKKNPKLHDPELIEQLKKSEHLIVREAAQEIEQKN